MNEIRLEQKIIIVSVDTISYLFDQENGSDLVALYMFYHKQCKIQKTNQSWTTGSFVMKGLGWGRDKFTDRKKSLMELGFIEDVVVKGTDGKVQGWYIKLNYIETTPLKNHLVDNTTCGNQDTNAGNNININAGSIKNKTSETNFSPEDDSTSAPFSSYTEGDLQQDSNNQLPSVGEESHIEKKEEIPSLDDVTKKYPGKELMKYIHSIMEQTSFQDKVDIDSFQKYYDHIINAFQVVYEWDYPTAVKNRDYIFGTIIEFRKYYALRKGQQIKDFKKRLTVWVENSLKFNNQK